MDGTATKRSRKERLDRRLKKLGRRRWAPIALLFLLLCVVVWLIEICDLPYLCRGLPRSKFGWEEALFETVLIAIIGFIACRRIIRDNQAQRRALESVRKERDKAQTYLDIAGVMIVAIDFDQKVILINKKGAEILGHSQEDITGKNWFENFLPERVREEVLLVFLDLMGRNAEEASGVVEGGVENPVLTKSGEERIIYWRNSILVDDEKNVIGTISSGEDITARKQAEGDLVNQQERLEEEVAARTAELKGMVDAMAGRVVRMADLETEIEELKARLKEKSGDTGSTG